MEWLEVRILTDSDCSNFCACTAKMSQNSGMVIGGGASLELVDELCYLGNMLSVDGVADASAEARIQKGWNKLGHLAPLPTSIFKTLQYFSIYSTKFCMMRKTTNTLCRWSKTCV